MRRIVGHHPLGIWIAIVMMGFCLLTGLAGQGLSLIDWDLAVWLQVQESDPRSSNIVERVLSRVEWGITVADLALVVPLFVVGFAGVVLRRLWGAIGGMMAAGCWVYMFVGYAAQNYGLTVLSRIRPWDSTPAIMGGVLVLLPCALIILGLGTNIDRFASPRPHSHMLRRLKLLIATYEERLDGGETNLSFAPHQRSPWRAKKGG